MDTVGIVGLGVMGSNCAKKLMESGVPVAGYDPYPPAVKRASEAGVAVCGSPAELAGKARVILMFVPGPADTEKVVYAKQVIGFEQLAVLGNQAVTNVPFQAAFHQQLAPTIGARVCKDAKAALMFAGELAAFEGADARV